MIDLHEPDYIQRPFKTAELDGKRIAFTKDTIFTIQLGANRKSSYRDRMSFTGNLAQAVAWYNCLNIGKGFKKRLICRSFNRPVLARNFSE